MEGFRMIKKIQEALRVRGMRKGKGLEIDETQQPRGRDGRCCASHFSIQQGVVRWNESRMGLLCLADEVPEGKPLMKFRVSRHINPRQKPMMSATVGIALFDHNLIPDGWYRDNSIKRVFFLGTLWKPVSKEGHISGERHFFVCERTGDEAFVPGFASSNVTPQAGDYFAVWLPETE